MIFKRKENVATVHFLHYANMQGIYLESTVYLSLFNPQNTLAMVQMNIDQVVSTGMYSYLCYLWSVPPVDTAVKSTSKPGLLQSLCSCSMPS